MSVSSLPQADDPTGRAELTESAEPLTAEDLSTRMERDWDERATENARHYVNTGRDQWSDEEFFRSGEATVAEQILNDMTNVCQGKDPGQMKVLEIGCGAGRVTRALARTFGQVYGVDVSGEMVRQAQRALAEYPNVRICQNNGRDLSVLGDIELDFVFSYIVFQHIPSYDVIEGYVKEVHRLLRPGGLFKFQVQGNLEIEVTKVNTWVGVPFSDAEAAALGQRCGFEPRYRIGAGDQYFWLWFFKR